MDERTLKTRMIERGLSVKSGALGERMDALSQALTIAFGRGTHADKVTFQRLIDWVAQQCGAGVFSADEVLPRVIDFALEATSPQARNPRAVFISICKKELGWQPGRSSA